MNFSDELINVAMSGTSACMCSAWFQDWSDTLSSTVCNPSSCSNLSHRDFRMFLFLFWYLRQAGGTIVKDIQRHGTSSGSRTGKFIPALQHKHERLHYESSSHLILVRHSHVQLLLSTVEKRAYMHERNRLIVEDANFSLTIFYAFICKASVHINT